MDHDDYDEDEMGPTGGSTSSLGSSTRSQSPAEGGGEKKIRKNHNEFEKRRRETQRVRLEELRQAVPGLDAKASMVAVLTSARVYIDELKARLEAVGIPTGGATLQRGTTGSGYGVPQVVVSGPGGASTPFHLSSMSPPAAAQMQAQMQMQMHGQMQAMPSLLTMNQLPPLVRKISSESGETRDDSNNTALFRKGRAELLDQLPPVAMGIEPESTVFPPPTRGLSPLSANAAYPNQARPSLLTSVIQDSFYNVRPRKDSGLLLPTESPDTFYYGQRDSLQSLMPVPLPLILDQSSQAYVSCLKCRNGVNGLVMIDCDSCRKWYHIRCVGIEASSIPVRWSCPECIS